MYSHFSGTFENLPQSGGSFDFHYSGHSSKAKALTLAQRPKGKLGNTIQRRAVTLCHIAQCMLDIVQYCMVLCCIALCGIYFNCNLSFCHLGSETDDYHTHPNINTEII